MEGLSPDQSHVARRFSPHVRSIIQNLSLFPLPVRREHLCKAQPETTVMAGTQTANKNATSAEGIFPVIKILKQGKQSQGEQLQNIYSTQNFSAGLLTCHNSLRSCEIYCENPLRVKIKRKRKKKGHREQEDQKDIKMCISLLSYRVLSQIRAW